MRSTSDSHFPRGLDRHNRAKRARIESTNGLMSEVQTELRHLQRGIASNSRNVEGFSGRVVSEASKTVLIYEPFFLNAADIFRAQACRTQLKSTAIIRVRSSFHCTKQPGHCLSRVPVRMFRLE